MKAYEKDIFGCTQPQMTNSKPISHTGPCSQGSSKPVSGVKPLLGASKRESM